MIVYSYLWVSKHCEPAEFERNLVEHTYFKFDVFAFVSSAIQVIHQAICIYISVALYSKRTQISDLAEHIGAALRPRHPRIYYYRSESMSNGSYTEIILYKHMDVIKD